MREIIIKGNESNNGFNPYYYFRNSLKDNTKFIFENIGLEYDMDESIYPTIEFKKNRAGLWDVHLIAPSFKNDGSYEIVKRHIKGLEEKSANVLYGILKCNHGSSHDTLDIKYEFRSDNMHALKMVAHCMYSGNTFKEGWHNEWDFNFTNMVPTYYKRIGWCGNYTTLKRLLGYFGESYRMTEKLIVHGGRETKWTNYDLDSTHIEALQKELVSLIPNSRASDDIEIENEEYIIESDKVKVTLDFKSENYYYQITVRNRRGTVVEAWAGQAKQEFDRDSNDVIKFFSESSWEDELNKAD